MKAIALIPARYGSSRFPGKPLAQLAGREVILHVCDHVAQAGILPVVATDDHRILECVEQAGYQAVMTSKEHRSGTDRICEALSKIESEGVDVVINVQGDEPFIRPAQLSALSEAFNDKEVEIATLVKRFNPASGLEILENPNLVKVVRADNADALYFSRSVIPFIRGVERENWPTTTDFYTHMGVYAYRPKILLKVASLPPSRLEKAESLEQLRWLQAGYRIRTVLTEGDSVGIDTPEDLEEAEKNFFGNFGNFC